MRAVREGGGVMSPDQINGTFELVGAWFAWVNALTLYREKGVRGVYWPAWAFFSAWGLWNLFYYPALEQWWSFYGGVALVSGNLAWVGLAMVYQRRSVIGSEVR